MNRRKEGGKQEHDPTWTQPITQPFPDWVHIAEAPFYCLSDGRMHAAKGWAEAFCEEVRLIASKRPGEIWTLHANENMMFVEADTLDVCTMISPGYFNIGDIAPKVGSDWWSISDFDVSARSTAIPAYARPAAD